MKYDYECDCKEEKQVVLLKVPKDAIDSLNYKNLMSTNLICEKCKKEYLEVMDCEYGTYFPD
jgi:hypothetical protein